MRVRLQEVARRASVSMQTVSRVIRTPHLVSRETAERVHQAMQELGYVKNEQAVALRLGRTRTIGLLLPLLAIPFWSEVAAGAEARAHEHGYSLLLCDTSDSAAKEEQYIALLLGYPVAGIIYAHPRCRPETHSACATLVQSDMPVAVISIDPQDLPYTHVHTDDRRAGYVAIRHFFELGRKRLTLVSNNHGASLERVRGAYEALQEQGIPEETLTAYIVHDSYEGGYAIGEHIATAQEPLPDAIFSTTDTITFGLLEALRSAGIAIPNDIAVASHDGLTASAFVVPPLTTIAPRAREMGALCIEYLLDKKNAGAQPQSVPQIVEADLLVRASTVGSDYASFHSFSTPISDAEAWSRWRTQPPLQAPPHAAFARMSASEILHLRE